MNTLYQNMVRFQTHSRTLGEVFSTFPNDSSRTAVPQSSRSANLKLPGKLLSLEQSECFFISLVQ